MRLSLLCFITAFLLNDETNLKLIRLTKCSHFIFGVVESLLAMYLKNSLFDVVIYVIYLVVIFCVFLFIIVPLLNCLQRRSKRFSINETLQNTRSN